MKRLIALSFAIAGLWQPTSTAQTITMNQARQQVVIDKTIDLVKTNYVYPEQGKAVETELRKNALNGKYSADVKLDDFLEHLNADLQAAGKDRHLRVGNNPRIVDQLQREAAGTAEVSPEFLEMLRQEHFRLRKVESLEGNIGYFKFDNFVELRFVKDAFLGAMNFLHGSSALIIDLSDNGGGASETSDLLVSYFLHDGTQLGKSWNRATDQTTVSTVTRSPEVRPMPDIPLYIIVGERTASAAEAVAYTLQQSHRATIVGSQTKGMANAGQLFAIDERLYIMVPTILYRSTATGTNWEGVGVIPDIAVGADQALNAAIADALRSLAERTADTKEKYRLLFLAQEPAALVSPQSPPDGFLDDCVGEYDGAQRIVRKDGALHYLKGDVDRKLSYMTDRTFVVEGRRDYRMRFNLDQGRVAQMEVLWFDDTSDTYRKVN